MHQSTLFHNSSGAPRRGAIKQPSAQPRDMKLNTPQPHTVSQLLKSTPEGCNTKTRRSPAAPHLAATQRSTPEGCNKTTLGAAEGHETKHPATMYCISTPQKHPEGVQKKTRRCPAAPHRILPQRSTPEGSIQKLGEVPQHPTQPNAAPRRGAIKQPSAQPRDMKLNSAQPHTVSQLLKSSPKGSKKTR